MANSQAVAEAVLKQQERETKMLGMINSEDPAKKTWYINCVKQILGQNLSYNIQVPTSEYQHKMVALFPKSNTRQEYECSDTARASQIAFFNTHHRGVEFPIKEKYEMVFNNKLEEVICADRKIVWNCLLQNPHLQEIYRRANDEEKDANDHAKVSSQLLETIRRSACKFFNRRLTFLVLHGVDPTKAVSKTSDYELNLLLKDDETFEEFAEEEYEAVIEAKRRPLHLGLNAMRTERFPFTRYQWENFAKHF